MKEVLTFSIACKVEGNLGDNRILDNQDRINDLFDALFEISDKLGEFGYIPLNTGSKFVPSRNKSERVFK